MKRLLIVDDSQTMRQVLTHIFSKEPDLQVVGTAKNGKEAVELVEKLQPDVITMDICMPSMDGIEAINRIMSSFPTPIVVISSKLDDESLNASFRALEAGALSVLEKPADFLSEKFALEKRKMIDTVKAMAGVKVFKRRFSTKTKKYELVLTKDTAKIRQLEVIGIGASVGGPHALKRILVELPKHFPVPIVVVQHMTPGFIDGFVAWLGKYTQLKIKIAADAEVLKPGCVYFAPDNYHLVVQHSQHQLIVRLTNTEPFVGFKPSVSVMFSSIANVLGAKGMGILLTGMGRDGAEGLLDIKRSDGHTIVQDEKSAIVFGMPGVALAINAVDKIVELDKMSDYLIQITNKS